MRVDLGQHDGDCNFASKVCPAYVFDTDKIPTSLARSLNHAHLTLKVIQDSIVEIKMNQEALVFETISLDKQHVGYEKTQSMEESFSQQN